MLLIGDRNGQRKKVYTNDGHCLGNEWVDLGSLQQDTKKAILQMIYLDEIEDLYSNLVNKGLTLESNNDKKYNFKRHCYRR